MFIHTSVYSAKIFVIANRRLFGLVFQIGRIFFIVWICAGDLSVKTRENSWKLTLYHIFQVEPFMNPVDRTMFPDYEKYVVHPMDLSQIKNNIAASLYGSTEAFQADVQWILHNSIIFNTCEQTFGLFWFLLLLLFRFIYLFLRI
jgi:hypothetical protein